jgi:hypothetical protein
MSTARIISEADIVSNRAAGYRLVKGELKNQEVGIYLDRQTVWRAVADRLRDGYRMVAPKRLLALLPE